MPVVSSDAIIKALKKGGFEYAPKRGKGSHMALYKIDENGRKLLVIVPKRRELPKGTLLSILQQANLSKDDFIELLKK
ncbi:MAG: type II toxin-antitoxin system HicA family toxin [Candidatus Syntrophoarchaeum sp.]|nr:type II toxin-antitoxin system HicA family toxin [Candidatus Syntrophoarchaeum sp.]